MKHRRQPGRHSPPNPWPESLHKQDFWLTDLAALDTPEGRQDAMKGTVDEWATEGLLVARQAYQVPETGKRLKLGQKLGDAYLEANLPVVRRRLYQAGSGTGRSD